MQRFILCFSIFHAGLFGMNEQVLAQKVHALIVGDISPSAGWGKYTASVAMDMTTLFVILHSNLPESNIDYRNIEIEEDEGSDPAHLLSAIQELTPSPNDTIFFYFTGHGEADDKGHYLALAKGKLYRQTIIDALLSKNARLAVIITDSCNSRSDGYLYLSPAAHYETPARVSPLFKSLMMEPKGIVDINSCSPGESAFFTPLDEEMRELPSSIFTHELESWMTQNQKANATWDTLVRRLSLQVHTAFKAHYPKGAQVAKGQVVQNQQTVYALAYPGKPENKGPRTGFMVRDFQGKGAIITQVASNSPASQIYVVSKRLYGSLSPQQVIVGVNGQPIENSEQLLKAITDSTQIARLNIRDALKGDFEVLIRLRY
jgi:Caspase domain